MRVCVIGGGLAGPLLAWRLAGSTTGWRIDVVAGPAGGATGASGGAVRCFETEPRQRAMAVASMVELLSSRVLREWAGYRGTGSAYLCAGTDPTAAVADIEHLLPGSASLVPAAELARHGWAGPGIDATAAPEDRDGRLGRPEHPAHATGTAVVERSAGYVDPVRFRDAVLADAVRRGVTVRTEVAGPPRPTGSGTAVTTGGEYDLVVVAAGPWTPTLLAAGGLPADGYRTKSIQFVVHEAPGWRPPHFVDEVTGLYGRPTHDGGLLLGVSTDRWDVDAAAPEPVAGLAARAAELAAARFPRLRLGAVLREACAADCYADDGLLRLRPVAGAVRTFTGGSGGSVKTVLAASAVAAVQLTEGADG